jgi:CheY-like chemotaxis protein
MQAVQLVTS